MSSPFNVEPVSAMAELSINPLSSTHAAERVFDTASLAQTEAPETAGAQNSFGSLVSAGLAETNNRLNGAESALQSLAVGGAGNLHAVMISMEGAKLAFQLVAQVRNHVLSAYQDIVKMQI